MGGVWDATIVRAWKHDREAPRKGKRAEVLATYREVSAVNPWGAIRETARRTNLSAPTVHLWLRELGEPKVRDRKESEARERIGLGRQATKGEA